MCFNHTSPTSWADMGHPDWVLVWAFFYYFFFTIGQILYLDMWAHVGLNCVFFFFFKRGYSSLPGVAPLARTFCCEPFHICSVLSCFFLKNKKCLLMWYLWHQLAQQRIHPNSSGWEWSFFWKKRMVLVYIICMHNFFFFSFQTAMEYKYYEKIYAYESPFMLTFDRLIHSFHSIIWYEPQFHTYQNIIHR